jgi:hypothetical protein
MHLEVTEEQAAPRAVMRCQIAAELPKVLCASRPIMVRNTIAESLGPPRSF